MDKKLFDVCLRSGEGDDEIIFNMGLDQETALFHAAVDRLKK